MAATLVHTVLLLVVVLVVSVALIVARDAQSISKRTAIGFFVLASVGCLLAALLLPKSSETQAVASTIDPAVVEALQKTLQTVKDTETDFMGSVSALGTSATSVSVSMDHVMARVDELAETEVEYASLNFNNSGGQDDILEGTVITDWVNTYTRGLTYSAGYVTLKADTRYLMNFSVQTTASQGHALTFRLKTNGAIGEVTGTEAFSRAGSYSENTGAKNGAVFVYDTTGQSGTDLEVAWVLSSINNPPVTNLDVDAGTTWTVVDLKKLSTVA